MDHLVYFLPTSPDASFLAESEFTITPGGTHAHGVTSNDLILLQDGCYIELIWFVGSLDDIANHYWGPDPQRRGWADWSLTHPSRNAEQNYDHLRRKGLEYQTPKKGSRKRPDNKEARWSVIPPRGDKAGQAIRGKLPFWCHDETDRGIRVPLTQDNTKHGCGALGVKNICIVIEDQEELGRVAQAYQSLFEGTMSVTGDETTFKVKRLEEVEGLDEGVDVVLRLPRSREEKLKVADRGFWFKEVKLAARKMGKSAGMTETIDRGGDGPSGLLWVVYL